ncbi:hypothetical protein BJ170DRAFT_611855 [Xylariales sp. AK1849]|nr:hypothetical protein BJ170DRAFT_611855 [Xylariales sp. AK1849]
MGRNDVMALPEQVDHAAITGIINTHSTHIHRRDAGMALPEQVASASTTGTLYTFYRTTARRHGSDMQRRDDVPRSPEQAAAAAAERWPDPFASFATRDRYHAQVLTRYKGARTLYHTARKRAKQEEAALRADFKLELRDARERYDEARDSVVLDSLPPPPPRSTGKSAATKEEKSKVQNRIDGLKASCLYRGIAWALSKERRAVGSEQRGRMRELKAENQEERADLDQSYRYWSARLGELGVGGSDD